MKLPLARDADAYLDLARLDERGQALVRHAYEYAVFWHEGQRRKGSDRPYAVHPLTVARILLDDGGRAELVAAALLHDLLEDTSLLPAEIEERFGSRVRELVVAVTRPRWRPWRLPADRDAALLKAADLACNLADTTLGLREVGDAVWKRFALGRRKVARWDDSLRQVERVLGAHPLVETDRVMLEELTAAAHPR